MNFKNLLLFALLLSPLSWAGPILVGRGSGLGEFNVLYAQRTWATLIPLCRSSAECSGGVEQGLDQLAGFDPTAWKLEFLTSADLGSTLYRKEDPTLININKDLLFSEQGLERAPWSYADAVEFWVRFANDSDGRKIQNLDEIIGRLRELATSRSSRLQNHDPELRNIGAVLFFSPFSTLVINDASQSHAPVAVEVPFLTQLSCSNVTGVSKPLEQLEIVNARWMSNDKTSNRQIARMTVAGQVDFACPDRDGNRQKFTSGYLIHVEALRTGDSFTLNPDSLTVRQEHLQPRP